MAVADNLRELGSQGPLKCSDRFLIVWAMDLSTAELEVASLADMDFHEEDASRLFGTHRTKNLRENHAKKTFRTVYFSAEEANYTRC